MQSISLAIYLLSFVALWVGAGLIIKSIDGFSKHLKLSPFSISFFFLGLLTSIPEIAVGFSAVSQGTPEIFVGNLLGGITVIFLFIIPILAILGRGIKLTNQLDKKTLLLALTVIAAPSFLILDKRVTNLEGTLLIGLYLILFFFVERNRGFFDRHNDRAVHLKSFSLMDIMKLLLGVGIVLIASRYAVSKTIEFAAFLNISTFLASLIILSLGTNLPELSLAIKSIVTDKKDIALGDYLGSAAANTLVFGFFTILNKGEVLTTNNFFTSFLFIEIALGMFYHFTRSEKNISRKEGIVMILVYVVFVALELSY